MQEDFLRQESDFGSLITGPQDTDFLDFSGFESNSDQVYEQQQADQDQLIYSGATITVGVSMLLIITFCTRYHLSGEAMANLLTLISVHCADVHPGLQSLHKFMKYFHHLKNPIICHKYCSHCLLLLNDGHENRVCPNDLRQQDLTKHGSTSFFIEVPVAKRPLYFIVNELPYNKRIRRENMIFAGLWFGTNKPQMLTFFSPFYEGLSKLETEGVNITIPGETACSFNSKVIVICGTCDLPAKCMVCNTVQYNGFYGCCKCKTPGRTVKTSAKGHMHAFPFNADNIKGEKRTSTGCMEDAKQAIDCGKPVNGIKGPCWLAALKYYDIIEGTAIDYMHCVLLGIVKMLLRLWFSKEHSSALFNISNRVKEVDRRREEIKYPNEISRCPRALEFHLKYYKASELRSFLLFCGLPVLHGILPDEYFQHFALLSESVFILLLDSISEEQLVHAERMLFHFCLMMGPLYRERYETANVHYLVHLVDNVRALGPLWTHSCFHFEDKNGFLLKLVHGTQNVQFQLVTAVSIIQKLPSLENDIEKSTEKAYKLYQAMQRYNSGTNETLLDRGIYAIGSLKYYNMTGSEFEALVKALNYVPTSTTVKMFQRIRVGRTTIYHSAEYKRVTSRNSYTVLYMENGILQFGQVKFYFQHHFCENTNCDGRCTRKTSNFAMVMKMPRETEHPPIVMDPIIKATGFHLTLVKAPSRESELVAVPLSSISKKCIFIQLSNCAIAYVTYFPNRWERD